MIDYQPDDYSNYRIQRAKDTIQEVQPTPGLMVTSLLNPG